MSFVSISESTRRKRDHVQVALHEDVEFHSITPGFERYALPYEALPEIDRSDVDTSTMLFGKRLEMPLVISSMTGGTDEGRHFNRLFAEAAQTFGLAMGVGSQRVALENPSLAGTFRVRDIAPDILLFANLGAVQLNNGCGVEECVQAIGMIDADALILHINPLQESIQPNGNTNFSHLAARIARVCAAVKVPVIVKEVGHGISRRAASLIADAGAACIDVAGAGGTSWAKVEGLRGVDPALSALGSALGEWGIPTVTSLLAAREAAPNLALIASGGVRTGEDIAKSVVMGAHAAGMALPLLKAAAISAGTLHDRLSQLRDELATIMFCAGARTIEQLRCRKGLRPRS